MTRAGLSAGFTASCQWSLQFNRSLGLLGRNHSKSKLYLQTESYRLKLHTWRESEGKPAKKEFPPVDLIQTPVYSMLCSRDARVIVSSACWLGRKWSQRAVKTCQSLHARIRSSCRRCGHSGVVMCLHLWTESSHLPFDGFLWNLN